MQSADVIAKQDFRELSFIHSWAAYIEQYWQSSEQLFSGVSIQLPVFLSIHLPSGQGGTSFNLNSKLFF
jgi:hypothetical protein